MSSNNDNNNHLFHWDPDAVRVPSRSLIRLLFENAIQQLHVVNQTNDGGNNNDNDDNGGDDENSNKNSNNNNNKANDSAKDDEEAIIKGENGDNGDNKNKNNNQNKNDNNKNSSYYIIENTETLALAGLLSLDQVLIPAVAHEENCAWKTKQAIIQRDAPYYKDAIRQCRVWLLHDAVPTAIHAVSYHASHVRIPQQLYQQEQWILQQKTIRDERSNRIQQVMQMEQDRLYQKRQQRRRKELSRNQTLWREVLYLVTELNKLKQEERYWKKVATTMSDMTTTISANRLGDFVTSIQQQQQHQQQAEANSQSLVSIENKNEVTNQDDVMDVAMDDSMADTSTTTTMVLTSTPGNSSDPIECITKTVQDMTFSCRHIGHALDQMRTLVLESDQMRRDLYQRYRRHHQFDGYHGVHDPKGLVQALSQPSGDSNSNSSEQEGSMSLWNQESK